MSGKPKGKDQYGPPLGSDKDFITINKSKAGTSSGPNKVLNSSSSLYSFSPSTSLLQPRPRAPFSSSPIQPTTPTKTPLTLKTILTTPPLIPPNPLISPNKFTPLYYQNSIVNQEKFVSSAKPNLTQTSPPPQIIQEEYFNKPELLPIITLERVWTQDPPQIIAQKLFPPDFNYIPYDIKKTRLFYEFILVDTDSIEVFHTSDNNDKIQFSKIKILRVIAPNEWGQPLFEPKTFSRQFSPQTFTYFDYMTAWSNMLYLSPETHSWFIWFRRGISLKFPRWFVKWFMTYGPTQDIFPEPVKEVYDYFSEKSTFVQGYQMISFIASQGITWIAAWKYTIYHPYEDIDMKMLARQIRIKWWKKFNTDLIKKERINEWLINAGIMQKVELPQSTDESAFLMEKQKLMAALASTSSKEELEKLLGTVSSTKGSEPDEDESSQSNPYQQNEDMFYY